MEILVINSGSSTVKFKLFDMEGEEVLAQGRAGRIGLDNSFLKYKNNKGDKFKQPVDLPAHKPGIRLILDSLLHENYGVLEEINEIEAVGHRVAHGGNKFTEPVLIDSEVKTQIEKISELAPLHNPHNLTGIEILEEILPGLPQAAVFDTAFNQTMPEKAYIYALPYRYYQKYGVRRYGFHGTSHQYVAKTAAEILNEKFEKLKIITCHLGNGASIAAINRGEVVDNSMGLTPLEGLVMGTRSGNIDPGILSYLSQKEDLNIEELDNILNKKSGLLGLSGISSDFIDLREAAASGHRRARLALEIFKYRIIKYIGSYIAALGGVEVIVFTGGIGENSSSLRADVINNFEFLDINLDKEKNLMKNGENIISERESAVKVLSVPTDEELAIARQTKAICINSDI